MSSLYSPVRLFISSSMAKTAATAATKAPSVMSRNFKRDPPMTSVTAPMNRYTRPVPKSGWVMMAANGTSSIPSTLQYSRQSSSVPW